MTTTFFSVDVETTSTNPFQGQLLTVGIVPIDGDTLKVGEGIHLPLKYKDNGYIDKNTLEWWTKQDEEVYNTAWKHGPHRLKDADAAEEIIEFVESFSPDLHSRVFCANPVSFDHPWLMKLFSETGHKNPWSHRTLCMRSMYFGITGGKWGENRDAGNWHVPDKPHDALSDAHSQALDLVKMYMMTHTEMRPKISNAAVSDVYD